jgi:hypothetical protein
MRTRRKTRQAAQVLSAPTGTDITDIFESQAEGVVASNYDGELGSGPTGGETPVGHTAVDLLYEKGIQRAFAKLVAELDPVEVLGTIAYVTLNIWGKPSAPLLSLGYFLLLLAGYHVVARPALGLVFRHFARPSKPRPGSTSQEPT